MVVYVWVLTARYSGGQSHIISVHESEEGAMSAKYMLEDINKHIEYDGAEYTITKRDLLH